MPPSLVRQKLARGDTILTAKACYGDPELVELIASSGFDAVWVCLEHKHFDPSLVYALIQACRLGGADEIGRASCRDRVKIMVAGARADRNDDVACGQTR